MSNYIYNYLLCTLSLCVLSR